MAVYRNIQLSFWTDNKVEDDFTPEDKYFYLYLLTNPQTNICGCYEVSFSQISHQTGYNKDTIIKLLERFEIVHKIIRYSNDTKEILILNWSKYNWNKSEKMIIGVENVAKYIKNVEFKEYVFKTIELLKKESHIIPTNTFNTCSESINEKKENTAKDLLTEFNISDYLLNFVNDWIEYKEERKFVYPKKGLQTLIKTISEMSKQYGDELVANAIKESISNGYQGIMWDKIKKEDKKKSNIKCNFMQRTYDESLEAKLLNKSKRR